MVRIYRSKTGLVCPELGRLGPDGFGIPDEHGRVQPLPVEAAGSCADLTRHPLTMALNRYPATSTSEATAVLSGEAGTGVQRIDVLDPVGPGHRVDIQSSGAFALPMSEAEAQRSDYVVTFADGSVDRGRMVRAP